MSFLAPHAPSFHFRYYAVTAPIKYSMHRDNHARAYIFIAAAWVASVAIGEFQKRIGKELHAWKSCCRDKLALFPA